MAKYNLKDGVWRTIGGRRVFIKNGQDLASAMKESGKFKSAKKKEVETITQEEYDKLPNDYKGTLKELVDTAEFRGENKAELIKKYEAMGFDVENDKTILKLEKGGTVLTPVKVVDNKPKLTKFGEKKEFTRQELKDRFGTDNVDLINAGRESENRVKLIDDSNWREQIKANNEQMEKDLQDYVKKYDPFGQNINNDTIHDGYYEIFRNNERRNAKIKQEVPTEKYEYVDSYAGYKDKFNDTWGKDGSIDRVVSARMYTNDEFMEHLEDANWHGERRQLLDADLTNSELTYIKNRTKVSAWGVENLTGKKQVDELIEEAKDYSETVKAYNIKQQAYQKYLKVHPDSNISFIEFKKWFK